MIILKSQYMDMDDASIEEMSQNIHLHQSINEPYNGKMESRKKLEQNKVGTSN
jgi:hypothetical protein